MNIILFGPPGSGKSTLIGILKSEGYRAIDLEDLYPSRIRFQIPNVVDGAIIAAADLNPAREYVHSSKVFLNMPQEVYDERRASRDAKLPEKANQRQHLIRDWLKGVRYDYVIDASGNARDTANKLKEVFKLPYECRK